MLVWGVELRRGNEGLDLLRIRALLDPLVLLVELLILGLGVELVVRSESRLPLRGVELLVEVRLVVQMLGKIIRRLGIRLDELLVGVEIRARSELEVTLWLHLGVIVRSVRHRELRGLILLGWHEGSVHLVLTGRLGAVRSLLIGWRNERGLLALIGVERP